MEVLNIPDWTAGGPMPESVKESLKNKVRSLRKRKRLDADEEVEQSFVEGLYPIVQDFSRKERERLLRQAESRLMTDKHPPKRKGQKTDKRHPERKRQKGQTEHAQTELNAVKDALGGVYSN